MPGILENNAGTVSSNLITGLGLDQTFQRSLSGVTYDLMTDALGSTVGLYSGGITSHTYKYEPYGASTQTGSGNHPYRFTGREWDGAIGLQYNRARYYNPAWGRFMSEDPGGYKASGPNMFLYGAASPTTLVDPIGLEGCLGGGLWDVRACLGDMWNMLWDGFRQWYDVIDNYLSDWGRVLAPGARPPDVQDPRYDGGLSLDCSIINAISGVSALTSIYGFFRSVPTPITISFAVLGGIGGIAAERSGCI